jgi:hypothetical protein
MDEPRRTHPQGEGETPAGPPNCWDIMDCGRGPVGGDDSEAEICPVAVPQESGRDGLNRGLYGGRVCWAVEGASLVCREQGVSQRPVDMGRAGGLMSCMECPAFKCIQEAEGHSFDFGLR